MYPIKPMYPKHSLLSKVTDCWTTNQLGSCRSFPCHRIELADIFCRWLQLWTKMVATTMMTSISGAQGKSLSLPHPWAGYHCPSEISASHLWLQYLSPHLLYYFTDIVHYFYPFLCSGWDLKRQIIVVDSLSTTGTEVCGHSWDWGCARISSLVADYLQYWSFRWMHMDGTLLHLAM